MVYGVWCMVYQGRLGVQDRISGNKRRWEARRHKSGKQRENKKLHPRRDAAEKRLFVGNPPNLADGFAGGIPCGWVRRWNTLRMDSRVKGLFHQLSLDGVDAITAEDEDLTIDEDFGSLLRSNDVFEA